MTASRATREVLIEGKRRDYNRLGFAVQVGTVRFLGMFLADPLDVPWAVVDYLAAQLGIEDPSVVKRYTERVETANAHAREIRTAYGYRDLAGLLQHLALAERLKTYKSASDSDRTHLLAEIINQSSGWRLSHLGDPRHVTVPDALAEDVLDQLERAVDPHRRSPSVCNGAYDEGDTTHFVIADRDENLPGSRASVSASAREWGPSTRVASVRQARSERHPTRPRRQRDCPGADPGEHHLRLGHQRQPRGALDGRHPGW